MLRNKYLIAGLGVLLLLVALYNISFFRERRGPARHRAETSQPLGKAREAARPGPAAAGKAAAYSAEWRRDPFWYPDGPLRAPFSASRTRTQADVRGLRLEGTTMKGTKGYALINGKVYGVGDRVAGEQITAISDRSVTLKSAEGTRTMHILTKASKEGVKR